MADLINETFTADDDTTLNGWNGWVADTGATIQGNEVECEDFTSSFFASKEVTPLLPFKRISKVTVDIQRGDDVTDSTQNLGVSIHVGGSAGGSRSALKDNTQWSFRIGKDSSSSDNGVLQVGLGGGNSSNVLNISNVSRNVLRTDSTIRLTATINENGSGNIQLQNLGNNATATHTWGSRTVDTPGNFIGFQEGGNTYDAGRDFKIDNFKVEVEEYTKDTEVDTEVSVPRVGINFNTGKVEVLNSQFNTHSITNHETLTTGLVSYWNLDEVSGTRYDAHGDNDLTDNNTVGSTDGLGGRKCASFDGDNEEYLSQSVASIDNYDLFVNDTDVSVGGWFNLSQISTDEHETLFESRRNSGSGSRKNIFEIEYRTDNKFEVTYATSASIAGNRRSSTIQLETNTWYFLVVTLNKSTGDMRFKLKNITQELLDEVITGTAGFWVGGYNFKTSLFSDISGNNNQDQWVTGCLQSVGVWSGKVLSDTEIDYLFNDGVPLLYHDVGYLDPINNVYEEWYSPNNSTHADGAPYLSGHILNFNAVKNQLAHKTLTPWGIDPKRIYAGFNLGSAISLSEIKFGLHLFRQNHNINNEIGVSGSFFNAMPYTKHQVITIDKDKIDNDITAPTMLGFDLSRFDKDESDLFDTVRADGADIQVTKEDGTVLEREVIIDKQNKEGELWVRHTGTLSSTTDTKLLVWYNGVSHVSNRDLGGRNRAWRDYQTVLHMDDTGVENSTGKHNQIKISNQVTSGTDGMIGKGLRLSDQGTIGNFNNLGATPPYHEAFLGYDGILLNGYTLQIAFNSDDFDSGERCILYHSLFSHIELCVRPMEGGHQLIYRHRDGTKTEHIITAPITTAQKHTAHLIWDGNDMRLLVDGVQVGTRQVTSLAQPTGGHDQIGRALDGRWWNGLVDEYRARPTPISNAQGQVEHENIVNGNAFFTVGAEREGVGAVGQAEANGQTSLGLPVGYQKAQKVTIDSDQVEDADVENYVVYVNLAHLRKEGVGAVDIFNYCRDDGGDIRVTKADGTPLPREVVWVDKQTRNGELHFRYTGTLSSSEDTEVLIWFNGVNEEPDADDDYGSEAVWVDYDVVMHGQNSVKDSTGKHTPYEMGTVKYINNEIGMGFQFTEEDSGVQNHFPVVLSLIHISEPTRPY